MFKKIKDNWFGIFISTVILFAVGLVWVVSYSPHNDSRMRGFAPCTYEMAEDLTFYSAQKDVLGVVEAVLDSYICYVGVMAEGAKLWIDGKQDRPWSNYIFEVESLKINPKMIEPFSEDLIKANKLNENDGDIFSVKELGDE